MKCIHCQTRHRNTDFETGGIKDSCYNCEIIVEGLNRFVEGINKWIPINTGKNNRRLIIKRFEIVKIKEEK